MTYEISCKMLVQIYFLLDRLSREQIQRKIEENRKK